VSSFWLGRASIEAAKSGLKGLRNRGRKSVSSDRKSRNFKEEMQ
jgi:hypothetical protein